MSIPGTVVRNIDESKVYRNVFTAEIGLLNSLSKERISRSSKSAPLIPIAKDDCEKFDTGILTRRQKLWTRARPNEGVIENPVLAKLKKQIKAKKTAKSASYFAAQEVRGLSSDALENDVQEPTGILERIQTNRKGRHEAVLEEMFQELSIINSELEPQINEACSTVREYLEQDQEEIIMELKVLDKDEDLINFTLKDLNGLWVKLGHHTLLRQSWIDELDLTLGAIETDRASLIEDVFKECTQQLVRIAHLMPTDVHKLMEDECLDTNKTLLANKRYCADLIRRLKMSDIERERKQYLRWKTRLDDWKNLKTATAVKGFSSFMTSPGIADPPSVQRQMNSLTTEQKKLNERRLDLLRHLREMKPPTSTKTAVYQWHNSLTAITEHLDETHAKYKGILSAAFEKVIYDCDEELTRVKAMLFNEGVRSEEDIEQLSTEQLAPLIGEKRARFEYELEKYEKYTDEITATQKLQFRMLFKYLQAAAHIWDQHELGLTREERELQERLDKNRKEHDTQNQIKEAKFDIVMDRLRQDASEEALAQSLKQSLEMLEEIKKSYHDFHGLQIKTANQYPSLVEGEIKRYDESVCACFGVSKKKPKIKQHDKIDEEQSSHEQLSRISREQLSQSSRDQLNQSSHERLPQSSQEQLLQTSRGQLSQTSREQLPQSSHERVPQSSQEQLLQTSRGQLSQTSREQLPQSSHEQLLQTSRGQLSQTSREQLSQSSRDQFAQNSNEQLPQTSRGQLSQTSREQLPQSSHEQLLQNSHGQLSQTSREQLSHSSREQLSQKSSRGGKKFSELSFDVLELSTGSIYYIIKDTDETTIPPDTTATVRTSYTFLTDDLDEVEVMPYVASFEICQDLLQQTKDYIRKEFLEHLESWKKDALQRAERVMTAKIEELHNELDLRLHLHEPRSGRAEKDVHNVRAAELVMHRDRVTQHCHGILASLSTFKSRFASMIEDHDNETEKFKNSVESLENTFVSATKSHQLLSIKDEVSNQLEEYMKVIRASLRKFRQDLDEMLNNLRNSNARFRRMLKIFSEGGNFCPDEVDEYRKKLENMASKIDNAEGSMMGELEGMETKRLDAGHEYSGKLEERFKHHLFDLTFLEKTARWLTNTQVKIKSEVANSNTQSQKIAKMIATFDRRIDAVLRPNLDREQINASELHETLMPMLEAFHVQVRYLDCAASEGVAPTFAELYATASKAETKQEEVKLTGKRSRKLKGSETSVGKPSKSKLAPTSKLSMRRIESEQRPITVPTQKSTSKISLVKSPSDPDGEKLVKVRSDSENRQSSVLKASASKYEKKYLAFGDGSDEYTNQFMKHITDICKDGLDGLLITSDMYYRQKGNRVATRASAIHDTFDMCAESLINRVRSYKRQAKDYRNTCMQELRAQVETFGKSLIKFPPLIVDFTFKQHLTIHRKAQKSSKKAFAAKIAILENQKRSNQTLLRPTLGHPNNRSELEKLTENENKRKVNLKSLVEKHTDESKHVERAYGKNFVDALNELTEKLLLQFDACLTVDDIQRGKVQPQPKSEKQLLREKMMSGVTDKPNDDDEKKTVEEQWKTLSTEEFTEKDADNVTTEPTAIFTRKVTPAHRAVIEARDKAYQQCCSIFKSGMEDIEEEAKKLQQDEERWTENWNKSISKILDLY